MSEFDWSEYAPDDDLVRWTEIGQQVGGTITAITVEQLQGGAFPVVTLESRDGTVHRVVIGPVDLRRQIVEVNPQVGDKVAIKFVEARAIGKPQPMKLFAVKHEPAVAREPVADDEPF